MENTPNSTIRTCKVFTNVYFEIDGSSIPYIVNSMLHILFAIIAAFANILVFQAIYTTKSIHFPSKLLLCNLVLTDLGVSLIAQPLFVVFLIAKVERLSDVSCFGFTAYVFAGAMLGSAALMTMTAIGVDRFIAFQFHRRYREIVTVERVGVTMVVIWVCCAVFASTFYFNTNLYGALTLIFMFLCVLVTSASYIKIYHGLRRHHSSYRVQAPVRAEISLDISKFRKSASSMLWIYCLFLLCYVPYVCTIVAQRILGLSVLLRCITEFAVTIVFFNSCLNPFVYCYRLQDIRTIVLKTLHKLCPFISQCDTNQLSETADTELRCRNETRDRDGIVSGFC